MKVYKNILYKMQSPTCVKILLYCGLIMTLVSYTKAEVRSKADTSDLPLVFEPQSGNILGGTVVNITGPCFDTAQNVVCHFDTENVIATIVNSNLAICIQPFLKTQGQNYVSFAVSIDNERFIIRGKYFVESPSTSIEKIHFIDNSVYEKSPKEIKIQWLPRNLTANLNANLQISLWGYTEKGNQPQLKYIDILDTGVRNTGEYTILPKNYQLRNNPENIDIEFGLLQINLTDAYPKLTSVLWSRPIPLAWYFNPQWERKHGIEWSSVLCNNWFNSDRPNSNFIYELPLCPCTIEDAVNDKGRFSPDPNCDKDSNPKCFFNRQAIHCVRSGQPSQHGSEQQCCYDYYGRLLSFSDSMYGSRPKYAHDMGQMPLSKTGKTPTLSQWYHDNKPFFSCCYWQSDESIDCKKLRFERTLSKHCSKYESPGTGTVSTDSKIRTFNNFFYKFNGTGEFVLAKANDNQEKFEVQGRFEKVTSVKNESILTSIATRGNNRTTVIEVKLRPPHAQRHYKLDVYADGQIIYFDRPSLKFQNFHGVTVYIPTNILNQSEVIIMYPSGVGVEINEKHGLMQAKVYIPRSFVNKIDGLLGNLNPNIEDNFNLQIDKAMSINLNNSDVINKLEKKWLIKRDAENSLFVYCLTKTVPGYV